MLKELDKEYNNEIVGVDEVGRGNAAGSMYICGVKLKDNYTIDDISFVYDSKKISKEKRFEIAKELKKYLDIELVEIYPKFIDEQGISKAMNFALNHIKNKLKAKKYIFDGKTNYKTDYETFIKGDQRSSLIAAASIIAKAKKDYDMEKEAEKYPEYNFNKNSGYLTKEHTEAIKKYGYTPIHRRSFKINALQGIQIKNYNEF